MRQIKRLCALALALLLPLACACADAPGPAEGGVEMNTLADMQAYFGSGKRVGIVVGTIFDGLAQERFPDAERVYFNTTADLITALQADKIDGYLVDKPQGYAQCQTNDQLWMPDVEIMEDRYGTALAYGNEALCAQMDEIILRMKSAGELDQLAEKWFLTDESQKPMPEIAATGEKGTLQLGTDGDSYPFSYIRDGQIVGYSVELFARICAELGYGCEVKVSDFAGMIAAVSSGKVEAASSCISITDERKEQMLFTEPIYDGGVMMVLPSAMKPAAAEEDLSTLAGAAAWIKGRRIGLYIGATISDNLAALLNDSEMVWMNTYADMVAALGAGRIDAFWCEAPIAQRLTLSTPGLYTPGNALVPEDYAFAMKPGNDALMAQLNATLRRLEADGTLEQLRNKWTTGAEAELKMPDIALTGENGTLRIATDAEDAPFGYVQDDALIGYDYEVLALFAQEHGYRLEYVQLPWDTLPSAVIGGRCDIACGCLATTDEHADSLLMSDVTYHSGVTLVTAEKYAPAKESKADQPQGFAGVWASICASFERTFVRENRWRLIAQGLGTTLLISVCAALMGTVLGFGVCMMRRSRLKFLSGVAGVFIRLMQGTPIVVFLMILYYIVFGDVNPVLVAIIGFALNFAAYVSEMMRTGIDAVDKGQIEAASAIGFTRTRAFLLITLPQAARHFLPVFRGEFISLVKMTSVVGYISIMDLTKMSDIIRSRTYEAFFPLIATAVLYFLLSWLLAQSLGAIERRVDPKARKRVIKGVREEGAI